MNPDVLRKKYNTFIYHDFKIDYIDNAVNIEFYYEIVGLSKFTHKLTLPVTNKNINHEFVKKLVFNIGLLELVSYYKLTLAPVIKIMCGSINEEQQDFFKKIYYHGLGELMYLNNIDIPYESFVTFACFSPKIDANIDYKGNGGLIAIGGGKDSCVTLSILEKDNNSCFIINPKKVMLECAYKAGYKDDDIYKIKRTIDPSLIDLNNKGFINGHTPFSAMVAFVSYLLAYLTGKEKIVLSNEASANEANVNGTKINHQYSKSYEFELDFQNYAKNYLGGNIKYYSLLRPLLEYQIGMIFAKHPEYHSIFKSCNVGSKSVPWIWCGNCAKCLFVYSLLAPHLYKDDLVKIFNDDLFAKESLLETFKELLGYSNVKPFDCVGTFTEINYAITKTIKNLRDNKLPYLLQFYKDNYYNEDILNLDLEHQFNNENSLSDIEIKKIKEIIKYDK